jgi:hypothetical protein
LEEEEESCPSLDWLDGPGWIGPVIVASLFFSFAFPIFDLAL